MESDLEEDWVQFLRRLMDLIEDSSLLDPSWMAQTWYLTAKITNWSGSCLPTPAELNRCWPQFGNIPRISLWLLWLAWEYYFWEFKNLECFLHIYSNCQRWVQSSSFARRFLYFLEQLPHYSSWFFGWEAFLFLSWLLFFKFR